MAIVSKSTYLNRVTGNAIVQEQERINQSQHMSVFSTQIYPLHENSQQHATITVDGHEYPAYDAFIYYNVDENALKELTPKGAVTHNPAEPRKPPKNTQIIM